MSITKDEIETRVRRVITEQIGVSAPEIAPHSRLKADLGGDELDLVELTMALEEEFAIEIKDETIGDFQDDPQFSDWVDIIETRLEAKKPEQSVTK